MAAIRKSSFDFADFIGNTFPIRLNSINQSERFPEQRAQLREL